MSRLRIGLAVPRRVGDPSEAFVQPDHREMLRFAQLAERLGFDSVWVPDHFYFEWPPGAFEPYPEVWTLMTAIGVTTQRVQIGSLVLAAGFRHPALVARMAGALQQLTDGRLVLGVGAGNQPVEHAAFGLGFEGRVGRLAEYLEILRGLLAGEQMTFAGRYYDLHDAGLLREHSPVPIWIAAERPRMLALTARYASGWNWPHGLRNDGTAFRATLAELREACTQQGRDPSEIEISCSINVLVLPDAAETRRLVDHVGAATGWPAAKVRDQYVIGTPDEVADRLALAHERGASHVICGLGGRSFTLWSESMLDLFASEVLPRLQG